MRVSTRHAAVDMASNAFDIAPATVISRIAAAIPEAQRSSMVIIGSLAAGFHYFADRAGMQVRTKDADCLLDPRDIVVRDAASLTNALLTAGWTFHAWDDRRPGKAETPDDHIPVIRLDPPGGDGWSIEILTSSRSLDVHPSCPSDCSRGDNDPQQHDRPDVFVDETVRGQHFRPRSTSDETHAELEGQRRQQPTQHAHIGMLGPCRGRPTHITATGGHESALRVPAPQTATRASCAATASLRYEATRHDTAHPSHGDCHDDERCPDREGGPHASRHGLGTAGRRIARSRPVGEQCAHDRGAGDESEIPRQVEHAGGDAPMQTVPRWMPCRRQISTC